MQEFQLKNPHPPNEGKSPLDLKTPKPRKFYIPSKGAKGYEDEISKGNKNIREDSEFENSTKKPNTLQVYSETLKLYYL